MVTVDEQQANPASNLQNQPQQKTLRPEFSIDDIMSGNRIRIKLSGSKTILLEKASH